MNKNDVFFKFCNLTDIGNLPKFDAALHFMWFNYFTTKENDIDIKTINLYFIDADLAEYPIYRLKEKLRKSSNVTKGSKIDSYRLSRKAIDNYQNKYANKLSAPTIRVDERAELANTPFLSDSDICEAKKMAELYIVIHCFENSVRRYIENILGNVYGKSWWDKVKNSELEKKYHSRKEKEEKAKWIGSRGLTSPLFYLDWSDLVKVIRKEESIFSPTVNDIKFLELRLEELERTRNVIAHNGVLPSEDDFDRLVLYFKDWCKQVNT